MVSPIEKKPINWQTVLTYTVLFTLLFAVIYAAFLFQGKTFIWEGDGFHQHYPFFREYLTILRHFFQTGEWQSWNWPIGLGADTLMTYGYYVVGDPFLYLGLLFPEGAEELAFHVAMFVRIWCVGASFLWYAQTMRFSAASALAGSLLYTFSHPVIYNVVRHPFFIHPLIFFPLLCVGVEKAFNQKSGVFFILMVALSAASNFYFFYMLTWLLVLYVLARYRLVVSEKTGKVFLSWFSSFTGWYLTGLLLASVIFMPLAGAFLTASRAPSLPPISLWLYPLRYYGLLVLNSVTPGTIFWTIGGFSVVGVFTLPFLFRRRRQKPDLFWVLLLLSVMVLFPVFGSFMNGLSGPYNRFTFIFPFYLALATVFFLDNSEDLTARDLLWMRRLALFVSTIYVSVTLVMPQDFKLYLTPVFLSWLVYGRMRAFYEKRLTVATFNRTLLGLILLNAALNALLFYLPIGKDAMAETEDYGTIDAAYREVFAGVEKKLPEDEWYRIGVTSHNNHVRNQYAYLQKPGLNSYASLSNGTVAEFAELLEASSYQIIQPLRNGIDDRRIANQALGVKYILTPEEYTAYLPADYTVKTDLSDLNAGMMVAETENAAPFAYVETAGLLRSEVEAWHPVQRESLLAEAVILEDESEAELTAVSKKPELRTHSGQWAAIEPVQLSKPASLNEPLAVVVEQKNSQLKLQLTAPEELIGREVFIYFEGITFEPPKARLGETASTRFRLSVAYNNQEKSVLQSDRYTFSSYFKRENILIHLNEVKTTEETLTVAFQDAGSYSFNNVSVVSRPFDEKAATLSAQAKNNQSLKIDSFSNERVTGTVAAAKAGMLTTTIPYSAGWQAYIDGEKAAVEKVNVGFVGVPVAAGSHRIAFVYQTPFLKAGGFLSGVGLLLLFGYVIQLRFHKRI